MFFGLNDVAFLAAVSALAVALDPDAAAYILAVEAADGQTLETAVRTAINDFVVGCKADGTWDAIKASCILAGARTLTGALVPLVGTAPTNFNFMGEDYNRKTGLVGNRSDKYLSSGRNNNADGQNDCHVAVYTSFSGISGAYIGAGTNTQSARALQFNIFHKCANVNFTSDATPEIGFIGVSRSSSDSYTYLNGESPPEIIALASAAPISQTINVFQRGGAGYTNARIAFYSIGESLDIALLNARVTALINAFDAAI
jgi:hypothetical protein